MSARVNLLPLTEREDDDGIGDLADKAVDPGDGVWADEAALKVAQVSAVLGGHKRCLLVTLCNTAHLTTVFALLFCFVICFFGGCCCISGGGARVGGGGGGGDILMP